MSKRTALMTADELDACREELTRSLRIGMCCDPIDRDQARAAISSLYAARGYQTPVCVFVDGPAALTVAGAMLGQLGDQLRGQLVGQLGGQLRGQLWDQLGDQLVGQLWDQLGDQLWDQLGGQLWDQLGDQLVGQLGDQLWDQLRDQLVGQLRDQLRGQLGGQLWGQLVGQLVGQLGGQIGGQLVGQLGGQLGGQLWGQLVGQLRGQLGGQLRDQLGDQLWGQHERYWVAHYAFARLLGVKYADSDDAAADAWMSVTETCGWFTPREGVCLVADRPEVQSLERGVLHRADGPAIKCRDGFEVFAWRGLRVPEWVITAPTVEAIRAEANTEIRRCAIENYGWDRYLNDLGVTPVASEADPGNPGHTLDLYDLPEDQQVYGDRVRVVVMRNASLDRDGGRRTFAETVPADIHSPVAAQAWAYDTDETTYRALERAT